MLDPTQVLHPPSFLKLEFFERRRNEALFERLDFTVNFIPGHADTGAIVKSWINGIIDHDNIVKLIEELMAKVIVLKRDFKKKNRLYRNLDSSWSIMLVKPDEYDEYLALLPKMVGIEERIEKIKDEKAKVKAEAELQRFKEIEPANKILMPLKNSLEVARKDRDVAREHLLEGEKMLAAARLKEKDIAFRITDDHVYADEQGKVVGDIFTNVQVGYVLSEINDEDVESLPFEQVINKIRRAKLPHKTIFRRYDYRYNPFTKAWNTLQELRDAGVVLDNPMISRIDFIHQAAEGNVEAVKAILLSGEDPNITDYTNCTPLTFAALNRHEETVRLLKAAGGTVDCRDRNMMTPLLGCIQRGHIDMVKVLLSLGANRDHTDKDGRGALFYAIVGGHTAMAKVFLNIENCDAADKVWGFAPLHIAAYQGNTELIRHLVNFGACLYTKDAKGRTPELVAQDASIQEGYTFLVTERLTAPVQLVHDVPSSNVKIWIGEHLAMDPKFCTDVNITNIVMILKKDGKKPHTAGWLTGGGSKIKRCDFICHNLDVEDDDNSMQSWENFKQKFVPICEYVMGLMKKGDSNILVCDHTGNSTSPAVVAAALLLHSQIRVEKTFEKCAMERPSVKISKSLRRGLDTLNRTLDDKRMLRIKAKLRHSIVLSNAF